ncbi:CPBP family intramembrane glutamic endopeptidase [Natrinema salaciae]|uniref:CAAX prenyl protease 2/Lysostaphin resistance protein A-like domain-containing protein n=1 Tax=Natrinema salaciae TaxID=1186196 RepID=A0A1H9P663_9EURY|nr:type II CAAX endopeptidase family protein [Natrinema salaciae]SER43672.1 hypothetical protein SAMN04489841_3874 [Natrinema salaciae]
MTAEQLPTNSVQRGRRKIGVFLLLTFGWSWGFWGPKALAAEGLVESVPALPELGAFGPTVAAFVLVTYTNGISGARRLARRAVRRNFPKRWVIPALFLSPIIVFTALGVAIATDASLSFPWTDNPIVLPIAFGVIFFLGGPVQEEFGWRGYLLDPLQDRFTALGGGLAVGLVWAVWHIPLFFIPSETIYYQNPFLGFAVSITLLSVLMTWVYNNTNASLLPALLFHTSFNWSQGMFPILDSDPASLTFVGLLAFTTVAVVVYWGPARLVRTDSPRPDRSSL